MCNLSISVGTYRILLIGRYCVSLSGNRLICILSTEQQVEMTQWLNNFPESDFPTGGCPTVKYFISSTNSCMRRDHFFFPARMQIVHSQAERYLWKKTFRIWWVISQLAALEQWLPNYMYHTSWHVEYWRMNICILIMFNDSRYWTQYV